MCVRGRGRGREGWKEDDALMMSKDLMYVRDSLVAQDLSGGQEACVLGGKRGGRGCADVEQDAV